MIIVMCGESQTLEHLLFDCRYVRPIWQCVEFAFGIVISYRRLLCVDEDFEHDNIATILCFLIYKEWLLLSLENKERTCVAKLEHFKAELTLRGQIYEKCKCIKVAHMDKFRTLIANL